MKQNLLQLTCELISGCRHCAGISDNPDCPAPIQCTKYSGSPQPICVNVATCLSCGEYKRSWAAVRITS